MRTGRKRASLYRMAQNESLSLAPMIFEPILVPKPWGGRRLAGFGKQLPEEDSFGESWEVADLDPSTITSSTRGRVTVAGGVLAGTTLRELIDRFGRDFLGSASPTAEGDFPLLVKLLDAREHLSVQVHPTAGYVADHPGAWLKTESWYILDAAPRSVVYIGFREGVSEQDVRAVAGSPGIVDLLQPWPAVSGEFHHLPAGTVHTLGAGVLVAEYQTPSDTTFRVYDWTDVYLRPDRELHLAQALETFVYEPSPGPTPAASPLGESRLLLDSEQYRLRELVGSQGDVFRFDDPELRVLTVVRGAALVRWSDDEVALGRGGTVVVPACAAASVDLSLTASSALIEARLV